MIWILLYIFCTAAYILYGAWGEGDPTTPKPAKDSWAKTVDSGWDGWKPPNDVEEQWRDWLNNYKAQTNGTDYWDMMGPEKELEEERERFGDWPHNWRDLGTGQGGADPPPWSYVPKNTGKPARCYMPPAKGDCNSSLSRWGYNPYVDACSQFTYSGCGGNANNFETQVLCEGKCMSPPRKDCEQESQIYVDDNIWT